MVKYYWFAQYGLGNNRYEASMKNIWLVKVLYNLSLREHHNLYTTIVIYNTIKVIKEIEKLGLL